MGLEMDQNLASLENKTNLRFFFFKDSLWVLFLTDKTLRIEAKHLTLTEYADILRLKRTK